MEAHRDRPSQNVIFKKITSSLPCLIQELAPYWKINLRYFFKKYLKLKISTRNKCQIQWKLTVITCKRSARLGGRGQKVTLKVSNWNRWLWNLTLFFELWNCRIQWSTKNSIGDLWRLFCSNLVVVMWQTNIHGQGRSISLKYYILLSWRFYDVINDRTDHFAYLSVNMLTLYRVNISIS